MKLLGLICFVVLLISLVSPGAPCPDLEDAKANLTLVEKLEKAEIVVYVQAKKQEDNITKYKVDCVMKTDGFMVEDEIDLSQNICEGAGDLPELGELGEYRDDIFVALIQRTPTGYAFANFGHNQTAHFGNPKEEVRDMNEACGLSPCPHICANINSAACPWDKADSPLVQVVKRMTESNVSIEYDAAAWSFSACCRSKQYSGGITKLTVSDKGTEVSPRLMRNVPKLILDAKPGSYHTVMMADVSGLDPELGTKSKPYIHWLQVNLKREERIHPNYTIFSYKKPVPRNEKHPNQYAFFVFEQEELWEGCNDKYKKDDGRSEFDISLFQKKAMLKLIYGAYVKSSPEVYTRVVDGASKLSICQDIWDDLTIVGNHVVCPASDVNTGTTPGFQGKLLAALLSLIVIIYNFI